MLYICVLTVAAGVPGLPAASRQSVCRHPVWHGDGTGRRVWRSGESSQEDEEGEDEWEDGHTSPQPGTPVVVLEGMAEIVWEVLHGPWMFLGLRWCSQRCGILLTSSYGPLFLSVVKLPVVNFQRPHVDRQNVLPGLPRPADRSLPCTTNLVHECSARTSSACRQEPSLHHQPSTWMFCQDFLGLPTGAFPAPPT